VFALLEEALEVASDFVPALALLAAARATSFIATRDPADLARAIAAADKAIAIDQNCGEAWSWRAYALLRQQRVNEALESYERATRVGDDATTSYLYGSTLASLGRFEDGLPHLQRAVTIEPRYGIGWLSLGWALHSLLREEAARYAMNRAKALEGQPGPTFVAGVGGYLAECLRSLGQLDLARAEALQGLESIERSDHSYRDTIRAFCLIALGRVCLDTGDSDGAAAAFAQAVAQMRGRTLTLAGGHVFVQALAGLARATGDPATLTEAIDAFDTRAGYSFNAFFGCADDTTAFELAVAADQMGSSNAAVRFLTKARAAGSRRPFELRQPP
jgi:tetratricopeptide (TPR) repeat protein